MKKRCPGRETFSENRGLQTRSWRRLKTLEGVYGSLRSNQKNIYKSVSGHFERNKLRILHRPMRQTFDADRCG